MVKTKRRLHERLFTKQTKTVQVSEDTTNQLEEGQGHHNHAGVIHDHMVHCTNGAWCAHCRGLAELGDHRNLHAASFHHHLKI